MVAMGESIFSNTYSHEVSGKYVGNHQVCESCHLDAGRLADSAPMWAARILPRLSQEERRVNTMIERIQGCFKYSMNAQASAVGSAPSADSETIRALLSYIYWLATDAPTGDKHMPGRGYPKLARRAGFQPGTRRRGIRPALRRLPRRGWPGRLRRTEMVFPPLWGERVL